MAGHACSSYWDWRKMLLMMIVAKSLDCGRMGHCSAPEQFVPGAAAPLKGS